MLGFRVCMQICIKYTMCPKFVTVKLHGWKCEKPERISFFLFFSFFFFFFFLQIQERARLMNLKHWPLELARNFGVIMLFWQSSICRSKPNHYSGILHFFIFLHLSLNRAGSLGHHRWLQNQYPPFPLVLHCPLGLGKLQACPLPDVVFPPLLPSALSSFTNMFLARPDEREVVIRHLRPP